jgi:hypothetical protein
MHGCVLSESKGPASGKPGPRRDGLRLVDDGGQLARGDAGGVGNLDVDSWGQG